MLSYLLEFNLLVWFFVCLGTLVNILSLVVNGHLSLSPRFRAVFLYGKASVEDKKETRGCTITTPWRMFESMTVPKRWFSHFYMLGSVWSLLVTTILAHQFVFSSPQPFWLTSLQTAITAEGVTRARSAAVLIAAVLFTVQTARRLYEHLFVMVASNSRMHVCHYLAGLLHYTLAPLALITGHGAEQGPSAGLFAAGLVLVFLVAWREQHLSLRVLTGLRSPGSGVGSSSSHGLPRGRLFSLVSCPHYTAELVMYASLWLLLGAPRCWSALLYWVVSNQVAAALMSHHWYLAHFDRNLVAPHAVLPWLL